MASPWLRVAYVDHAPLAFGAERGLREVLRVLPRLGVEPVLLAPPRAPWVPSGVRWEAAPLFAFRRRLGPLALGRQGLAWLRSQREVHRLLRRLQPHLVHANTTSAALCAALPARCLGLPFLWHVRDLTPLWPEGLWLSPLSDAIVAISDAVALQVRRFLGRQPRRIPNGVEPEPFLRAQGQEQRQRWGWTGEEVVFGFVGQWVPWKRPDFFLQVAAEVAAQEERARFVLVGGEPEGRASPYGERLRRWAAEPPLRGKVRLEGYRWEIPPVLAALDVLVLPSRREPFGRILVEAMLAGKPVMATAEAGPLEIVVPGETGWLLPPQASAWVQAMREAVQRPHLRQRMGCQGRQRALRFFTLERMVEQWLALYQEILSARRHCGGLR